MFTTCLLSPAVLSQHSSSAQASADQVITNKNATASKNETSNLEEVKVWGKAVERNSAGYVSPTSLLTPAEMAAINVATTEDLVKFEPSLVIRRRFIGDSNGTMGVRGSNMFQTSRSMVFADGVPLHYLLQSRWSGAPRWTMVSASEIAQIEVVYGPFSAEYSGNAMGGVVLIETATPEKQEFHFDATLHSQTFNAYGFDDTVGGYNSFLSYGNKFDKFSLYLSYNHLDSESQPQTFYYGGSLNNDEATAATVVSGGVHNIDERGNPRLYFGDTGVVHTASDNFKIKLGYDLGDWSSLFNLVYEDRLSASDAANTYMRDSNGNRVWSGNVIQDDTAINIPQSRLNASELNRNSLSLGLRVRGPLSENLQLETNLSRFAILRDRTATSQANPAAEGYNVQGSVQDLAGSGWNTAEIKLKASELGLAGVELITGLRYEAYELEQENHASDDYTAAEKTILESANGGSTNISAVFIQANWDIDENWSLSIGGRYESYKSHNGYYSDDKQTTPELDLVSTPETDTSKFSPKFSLGYNSNGNWSVRYSLAKAYRFPIVEELYSQYSAYNSISEANPELKPEDGLHHNLMFDYELNHGYARINLFSEVVKDTLESQTTTIETGPQTGTSIRTFVPIDEVQTNGVEFIVNNRGVLSEQLDLRFNLTYTHSEIVNNSTAENTDDFDPTQSIVGNTYPRMPKWRSNLMALYHLTDKWNLSATWQYSGNSYGRTDNKDNISGVYGAQDSYSRLGLKTQYQFDSNFSLGFGVDNITNQISYVAHPWPGRTLYLNISYDL
jgi:Outer membrane receptor proteins, mostly Fe transport